MTAAKHKTLVIVLWRASPKYPWSSTQTLIDSVSYRTTGIVPYFIGIVEGEKAGTGRRSIDDKKSPRCARVEGYRF